MMAGDHQTDDMGISTLTEANSMTFVFYFVLMFLILTLIFSIFTGIAISEIQGLIDDSNIETMKEKIEYIYEGIYSIPVVFEEIECVRKWKKIVFGKLSRVFGLGKLIGRMLVSCGRCRDRLLSWLGMLRLKCFPGKEDETAVDPDGQLSTKKSDTTKEDFIEDKYIEYFEDIENRIKSLEERLENSSKNLEEKLDKLACLLIQKRFIE